MFRCWCNKEKFTWLELRHVTRDIQQCHDEDSTKFWKCGHILSVCLSSVRTCWDFALLLFLTSTFPRFQAAFILDSDVVIQKVFVRLFLQLLQANQSDPCSLKFTSFPSLSPSHPFFDARGVDSHQKSLPSSNSDHPPPLFRLQKSSSVTLRCSD